MAALGFAVKMVGFMSAIIAVGATIVRVGVFMATLQPTKTYRGQELHAAMVSLSHLLAVAALGLLVLAGGLLISWWAEHRGR